MEITDEEWWEAAELMWKLSKSIAKNPERATVVTFFKGVKGNEAETIVVCKSLHRWFHEHDIGTNGTDRN